MIADMFSNISGIKQDTLKWAISVNKIYGNGTPSKLQIRQYIKQRVVTFVNAVIPATEEDVRQYFYKSILETVSTDVVEVING